MPQNLIYRADLSLWHNFFKTDSIVKEKKTIFLSKAKVSWFGNKVDKVELIGVSLNKK